MPLSASLAGGLARGCGPVGGGHNSRSDRLLGVTWQPLPSVSCLWWESGICGVSGVQGNRVIYSDGLELGGAGQLNPFSQPSNWWDWVLGTDGPHFRSFSTEEALPVGTTMTAIGELSTASAGSHVPPGAVRLGDHVLVLQVGVRPQDSLLVHPYMFASHLFFFSLFFPVLCPWRDGVFVSCWAGSEAPCKVESPSICCRRVEGVGAREPLIFWSDVGQ